MKRLFWLSLGAAAGVAGAYWATRKLTELKQSSPAVSLAAGALDKARDGSLPTAKSWREEFARTRAAREAELREALGMPDAAQVEAARDVRAAAKGARAAREPRLARPATAPGGLKPEDFDDPLYEF